MARRCSLTQQLQRLFVVKDTSLVKGLGGVPVIQEELDAIPRKFLEKKQWSEPLVRQFQQAFPEAAGEINKFSLARAAGYITKFHQVIGWELNGNANGDPHRFDWLLVKACARFWRAKDNVSVGPKHLHPRKDDLDSWAREYKHGKGPAWMTPARLDAHAHPQIIKSFAEIQNLKSLSPIFAEILDTRPPTIRQGRKEYQNTHGRIENMPENHELRAMANGDEEEVYLGPIIYTKFWFPVLQRFYQSNNPNDIPALPRENVMPGWGDGDLMSSGCPDRMKKYDVYVKKCKKFGRNALVVYLLSELKRSVGKQREFKSILKRINICLQEGLFDISPEELQRNKETNIHMLPPEYLLSGV
ncbi:uncharacterized protein LTHEOB_4825 [Lasiodiplodia theobromae]|uniref:uncharacterized protein n=1 Tax=Lasiodiplodia theobromae TaxID=45133 RepID=UPI0015C3B7DF|nr:uncharacterized protein LTHEOB_4825 [Lasiodiplodia theobromae]KAF4545566.1 hypothetical protein LTHEOB_4825 [Lasiodiplodia theobromae]